MNVQFKKGVLNLCVLSLLAEGDKYGYEMAETISRQMDISEGTLYPLLRRLKADGLVETYLQESPQGPPRKYYQLSAAGQKQQTLLKEEWVLFVAQVNQLIGGNES